MRWLLAAVLLIGPFPALSETITADMLARSCAAADGSSDKAECTIWLHGFYNGFAVGRAEGSGELTKTTRAKACPPATIDAPKSAATLRKYLDGHPWSKDANPAIALHLALVDDYPCP